MTKSEPRRIWPNKVILCDEEDMKSVKQQHKKTDEELQTLQNTLALLKMDLEAAINESLQSEEMLKQQTLALAKEKATEVVEPPKPKGVFVYQRSFSIPNEVRDI